jgi:uncharacterized protein (DUF305 family)
MNEVASPQARWTGVLAGAVAGALLALAIVWLVARARAAGDDSAEAGFARDMATHHAQAAEMAFLVRDASTDPQIRTLAYDIIVTQTAQRGIFMGWLQQWQLPQASSGPRMAWMPAHHHEMPMAMSPSDGLMPGMASAAEIDTLTKARGVDAEILFLQLMIRHHEGGVLMARALLARSARDEVSSMAKAIDSTQTSEIALMREMLAARGGEPFPSMLTGATH